MYFISDNRTGGIFGGPYNTRHLAQVHADHWNVTFGEARR
jgi:hypothetical protein